MKLVKLFYTLAITTLWSNLAFSQNDYCIAVRGNGEIMPAHWGALAQTIEIYGIPKKMAGGSSASITTFLTESVLMNPLILNERDERKKIEKASFLIKSFQGFFIQLANKEQYRDLVKFLITISTGKHDDLEKLILNEFVTKNGELKPDLVKNLNNVIAEVRRSKIFYGPLLQRLEKQVTKNPTDITAVSRLLEQIKFSVQNFGKFNAREDDGILLRDGIINFPALAEAFGKMANFYSLRSANSRTNSLVFNNAASFLEKYSENSIGKTWLQSCPQDSACMQDFSAVIENYFSKVIIKNSRTQDLIGSKLGALISTSIATGKLAASIAKAKNDFDINFDLNIGKNLQPNNSDLKFGYWGNTQDLNKVQVTFAKKHTLSEIDKSKRFLNLGSKPWIQALSASPAEPGLSSFVKINDDYISLGGWSDLAPTVVLKASGCKNVVYITRQGGDSFFAQGIAKRLIGFPNMDFSFLDSKLKANKIRNNDGFVFSKVDDLNKNGLDPLWSKMYNMSDSNSSIAVSLSAADSIICTHWGNFKLQKNFTQMIEEAYHAEVFEKQKMSNLRTKLKEPNLINLSENVINSDGFKQYSGCVPNF